MLESIEHEPVGSGACAQVHRAVLADDGQAVAVKVLHPRIAEHFARDLRVLRTFATIAEQIVPSLHWLSLGESLDEFSRLMISQVQSIRCIRTVLQIISKISHLSSGGSIG